MSEQSDTPETDTAEREDAGPITHAMRGWNYARKHERERDEARARVLADVVEMLSAQHTWLTRVAAINLVAGLYGQAAEVFAAAIRARADNEVTK